MKLLQLIFAGKVVFALTNKVLVVYLRNTFFSSFAETTENITI